MIYWTWNNLLSPAQQWYIMRTIARKIDAERHHDADAAALENGRLGICRGVRFYCRGEQYARPAAEGCRTLCQPVECWQIVIDQRVDRRKTCLRTSQTPGRTRHRSSFHPTVSSLLTCRAMAMPAPKTSRPGQRRPHPPAGQHYNGSSC